MPRVAKQAKQAKKAKPAKARKPAPTKARKPAGGSAGSWVAFLRGVNVGGRNSLPMKDLARLFERAGCGAVKTYIQSGNVVFTASSVEGLAARIEADIRKHAGFHSPVVLRSAAELRSVLDAAPFRDPGGEKPALHVMFLADEPREEAVRALDENRSPGDRFAVRGREIYLLCPNGLARTLLTNAYFDGKLKTTSTSRNFRTVEALLALCEGA